MRFYLDTEFNGFGGELISLALVPALPEYFDMEFYAARRLKSAPTDWVRKNVIPVVNTEFLSDGMFRKRFHHFLRTIKQEPEFVCDWHADAKFFCDYLAGHDYGSSLDYACSIRVLKTPPNAYVSDLPHNARADARALRDWHLTQPMWVNHVTQGK